MAAPLPSNITIVEAEADGKTIRDLAISVNVAYLTPYYQVKRKENISVVKDVIAVTDTAFYQGADARNFLGISTTTKVVLKPSDIPAGCEVFVQTTSHNRKIPVGTKCLLQTAASADVAVAAPVPVAASAPVPPATLNRSRPTTYSGLTAPDAKRPRLSAEEEQDDDDDELGSKVLSLRLNREGARSCEALQCSLIWNDIADLDLSCVTPDGETIYYGNKETECGGWLDVDMNVNKDTASLEPVENIFWASAPSGKYVFKVTNFNCHSGPQRSVFTNADRSVPYRVFLTKNGKKELFDGSVGHKQVQTCFEFELEGDGALGSYVVMPPSDVKTTFKEACEKHGVTYTQGTGYYALARKENISKDKAMLLQHIEGDTFTIGSQKVRTKLGWPLDVKQIRKGPQDLPEGYRLFVQSTSHNRLIPPGTHTLMKVSVKEALQHRAANNTRFKTETHTMGRNTEPVVAS